MSPEKDHGKQGTLDSNLVWVRSLSKTTPETQKSVHRQFLMTTLFLPIVTPLEVSSLIQGLPNKFGWLLIVPTRLLLPVFLVFIVVSSYHFPWLKGDESGWKWSLNVKKEIKNQNQCIDPKAKGVLSTKVHSDPSKTFLINVTNIPSTPFFDQIKCRPINQTLRTNIWWPNI